MGTSGPDSPNLAAPQTTGGSGLGDVLAGLGGAPVNRPALGAYIAQGQALTGLRTAQTEDALVKAQQAREEMSAGESLKAAMVATGMPASQAELQSNVLRGHFGTYEQAMQGWKIQQDINNRATLGDPNQMGSVAQTAAQQGVQGKVAEPVAVGPAYTTLPGAVQPNVHLSPIGAADVAEKNAQAAAAAQRATNAPGQMDPTLAPIIARFIDQNPAVASNFRSLTMGQGPLVTAAFMAEHGDPDAQAYMKTRLSGGAAPPPGVAPNPAAAAPGQLAVHPLQPGQEEHNAPQNTPPNGIVPAPGVSLSEQAAIRKDFASGVSAKQVTALNTAYQHSVLLDQLADRIGNGNFTPTNAINVAYQKLTGSPAPANLQEGAAFLGREAVRATVNSGAGTGEERGLQMSDTASPAQMHGVAQTVRSFLGGQLHSLDLRARAGGKDISPLLSPEARKAYGMGEFANAAPGSVPNGQAALPSYASEAEALAAGHKAGDRIIIGGQTGTLQ